MPLFEITLFIEPDRAGDAEIEISRLVEAADIDGAMELAEKLRHGIPEIDPSRVTAWHIEKRSVDSVSDPASNFA